MAYAYANGKILLSGKKILSIFFWEKKKFLMVPKVEFGYQIRILKRVIE